MVKRKRVQSPAAHTDDTNKRSNIIEALDELGTTSATPNAKLIRDGRQLGFRRARRRQAMYRGFGPRKS